MLPALAQTVHHTVASDLFNNDGGFVTVPKLLGPVRPKPNNFALGRNVQM